MSESYEKKCDYFHQFVKYAVSELKQNGVCYAYNLEQIKDIDKEKLKEETIKKSYKGKKCEWCGNECYILQQHHYPISAKDGGTKLINICPNCHYTFHKLESEVYE